MRGKAVVMAVVLVGIVSVGAGLYLLTSGPRALEFAISYKDARGLSPGQAVVFRGQKIGEVTSIDLRRDQVLVHVRVDAAHQDKVFRESKYRIEKPGGTLDLSGERQISVDSTRGSTPIRPGEEVVGSEGILSRIALPTADDMRLFANGMKQLADAAARRVREYADTSEGKELLGSLETAARDLKGASEKRLEEFRKEQLPELRKKAAKLRDRLIAAGKTKEAKQVWEEVTKLLDKAESSSSPSAEKK